MKALGVVILVTFWTCGYSAVHHKPEIDLTDEFFTNGVIPRLRIRLNAATLDQLRLEPRAYVRATVTEAGTVYRDVGLHLKGQYGTFQTIDGKPSLTLSFDKYVNGQGFHGLDKFHVNNSLQDPTYLNELVGRDLFQRAGLPVGRATHARVELNGRDLGLFLLVEGYGKTFLQRHFKNAKGNLYDSEFMRDINLPLKKGSGAGPDDHSDLKELVTAAAEHDPDIRLKKLAALLDLDKFYTFLAVELMARHHDGYAMSKNNYWLYHDPSTKKMVFIPHGMDQMFYQPQASLLPELQGVVARAVLEAPRGCALFRERCTQLYSNLFSDMSNRVAGMQIRLNPLLSDLGTNALQRQTNAVADLQRRAAERVAHVRTHLFTVPPTPMDVRKGEQVRLSRWIPNLASGSGKLFSTTNFSGALSLNVEFNEGVGQAIWQCPMLLPKGQYAVFVAVVSEKPVFKGPTSPVALQVWGLDDVQFDSRVKDTTHAELLCVFAVTSHTPVEANINCEVRSNDGPLKCRFESMAMSRLP